MMAKRKRYRGNFHQTLAPLLFLSPNVLIFGVFIIAPAMSGLKMSVMDWSILGTPRYIGLRNFERLFRDRIFGITVQNTLVYSFFMVILITVLSLVLALLLYKNSLKGERLFRSVFYVPSLLSMITVGIAWRFILGDEMGVINYLLRVAGAGGIGWLSNPKLAMGSIIFVSVWAQSGYYMVILIAGLQAIPVDLYEAAKIDGCGRRQTFWKITLPMLKSTLLAVMVLATISSFKAYELINVMTDGGPGYSTKLIVQQVYQAAFAEDRMGYASAMSLVLMLIIGIFTLVQFKITGKEHDHE